MSIEYHQTKTTAKRSPLLRALASLDSEISAVFVDKTVMGLSTQVISSKYNLDQKSVWKYIHIARTHLMNRMSAS